jgi:pimeloyl-ACP methyl ester carboxylesterase
LDGKAASLRALKSRSVASFLRVAVLSIADLLTVQINTVSRYLGLSVNLPPVYVKIMGSAQDTAYMILNPADQVEYFRKHPKVYLGGWNNLAPARTMAVMSQYSPKEHVASVKTPILFVAGTHDELCPIESIRAAAVESSKGRLLEVNATHFELYNGPNFQTIVSEMLLFASECVGGINTPQAAEQVNSMETEEEAEAEAEAVGTSDGLVVGTSDTETAEEEVDAALASY